LTSSNVDLKGAVNNNIPAFSKNEFVH